MHDNMLCQADPLFTQKVLLGDVSVTEAVEAELSEGEIRFAIQRHAVGDWGAVDGQGAEMNHLAQYEGRPVRSVFISGTGRQYWVTTDRNHSRTHLMFPEEH